MGEGKGKCQGFWMHNWMNNDTVPPGDSHFLWRGCRGNDHEHNFKCVKFEVHLRHLVAVK